MNEPLSIPRYFSWLSAHGPNASNSTGRQKAVPIVCDYLLRFDSAAAVTISLWVVTVLVISVTKSVV